MSITKTIQQELKNLFLLKKTNHKWHSALLASICVGIPLLIGLYFNHIQHGLLGCLSGLVILYLPKSGSFTNRMATILICSFGFLFSFTFGQLFSFNPVVSSIAFGIIFARCALDGVILQNISPREVSFLS